MPTVPSYQSSVSPAALPSVRISGNAPIEAFGGGQAVTQVNQAAQSAAQAAHDMALEQKRKADQVRVQDALNQTRAYASDLFWNPQSGAMSKKGKDAFGVSEQYMGDYDKYTSSISDDLANDDQRAAYHLAQTQFKSQLDDQLNRHIFSESKAYEEEVTKSSVAGARSNAVLNYNDPRQIQQSVNDIGLAIAQQAERNGLGEEWRKLTTEQAVSKTHVAVMDRMLDQGNDRMASQYFKANKSSISGDDIGNVEKALEEGSIRGESQRIVDGLRVKGVSEQAALAEIRKIDDPKLRDATQQRYENELTSEKRIRDAQNERRFQSAINQLEQNPNYEVPEAQWLAMDLQEKQAFEKRKQQKLEGIPPVTNWNEYYDLKSMASSPQTREEFLRTNLMVYRPNMADAEFKELVTLQTGLRNGDEKAQRVLDGYRTDAQIVNDALNQAGIDPTPKQGTKSATQVNQFRSQVDAQIAQLESQTKKKATNAEVQDIVDNLMIKGITNKGIIFDTKKRAFELQPGDVFDVPVEEIPASDRRKIEEALTRKLMPISDEAVRQIYLRKLRAKGLTSAR